MARPRLIDQSLTLEELANQSLRRSKWRPVFIRLAREYSRAGVTSERALARQFAVDGGTIRYWRLQYPAFDAAIRSGEEDLAVECTSRMLDFSREGSETATRYLLDRRVEAFKPKAAMDHTSNGETLSALLAQHGAMSDKEAIDKGLIIDHEAEESEPPRRTRKYLED
jgi:transposase-like protein